MEQPVIDRRSARELDRRAMTEYGIPGMVLMENAGRGVADVLCRLGVAGPVVVCCGKGNNGGDGFVLARHLDLRGLAVQVLLWANPQQLTGDAAANFQILQRCDVPIEVLENRPEAERATCFLAGAEWIVDALLGTGARGNPRPPFDAVIDLLNAAAAPKLAVDLPSGLDCDTGCPGQPTIRAAHTCTFVAPKRGFSAPEAQPFVGQVHVLDIGAPRKLVDDVLQRARNAH